MFNRHRRTRIYGANYDIGESYYKQQLNDLDIKKRTGRNYESPSKMEIEKESRSSPRVTFCSEDLNDSLSKLRTNTDLHSEDDNLTKSKKFRRIIPSDFEYDEEYTKNGPNTTREVSIQNDRHKQFGKNLFYHKDESELKIPFNLEKRTTTHVSLLSKFVKGDSICNENAAEENDASLRANASKARLVDLEEQINSITNKQNEREKRNKNLKKILSEITSTTGLL